MLLFYWQIARTLSNGFELLCIIHEVLQGSNDAGVAEDNIAEARAHFLDDDRPVPSEIIEAYVFYILTILSVIGHLSAASPKLFSKHIRCRINVNKTHTDMIFRIFPDNIFPHNSI